MESHLLQMRGLKLRSAVLLVHGEKSHLLQMRGLKQITSGVNVGRIGRIFYRCVD